MSSIKEMLRDGVAYTDPKLLPIAVCSLLTFYFVSLAVYRLLFHPLAKVPGPLLGRVSGWYPTIGVVQGRRHLGQYECHRRYGSVVRWAPNYVIFDSASAIQTIYAESRRNNVRKDDMYEFFDDPKAPKSTITTMEKGPQGRKRRILSHAFSPQAMQGADEILFEVAGRWRDSIRGEVSGRGWSDGLDIRELSDRYTMDASAQLAFGNSFDLIGSPEFRFLPSGITRSFHLLNFVGHSPVLAIWPTLKRLRLSYLLDYHGFKARTKFTSIVNGLIGERTEIEQDDNEASRKDFYHFIRNSTDSETKEAYTMQEVLIECSMLMAGGTGGPSTMLTGVFFYLTAYPDVLEKLTKEIRETFASSEDIKAGPSLTKCTYLQAVSEESVRLSTAHQGTLPRRVMKGGQVVDEVFLPEGTTIGIAAYAVHHREDYFPDPFRFWPERWIENEKEGVTAASIAKAKSALFSFSAGGNNCIGKPTAYRMINLALARVLWEFDIRRQPGNLEQSKELPFEDMFSARPAQVMIQFKRRPSQS